MFMKIGFIAVQSLGRIGKMLCGPVRVARAILILASLGPSLASAQSTSLLRLHTIQIAPGSPTQFFFTDQGTGATNYAVEFSPAVGAGSSWSDAVGATVTSLGESNYQVVVPASPTSAGFYRVRAKGGGVTASFTTTAFQVLEGGAVAAVINLTTPFFGVLRYSVSGTAAAGDYLPLSGEVLVNGNTAVIPVTLTENSSIGEIRSLTLRLEPGAGYRVGTSSQTTITIDEDDADWQGSFMTGKASVGFVLRIQRTAAGDVATLRSDRFGFFPTNEIPASVMLTETNFHSMAANIPVPADATLLNSAMSLFFELTATNGMTNQTVSSTLIQGHATLINTIPGREYLNNTNQGTFILLKSPVKPSTNEVLLLAQP